MAGGEDTPAADSALTFAQFKSYLSTTHRIDIQGDINAAVDRVSARVDATQADLSQHKKKVNEELGQIKESIARTGASAAAAGTSYAAAARSGNAPLPLQQRLPQDLLSQEHRAYWHFRKCAKMHSVPGKSEQELWAGLQDFLRNKLRIPTTELNENDVVGVRRLRSGRGPNDEVLVTFGDVDTRDRVCSYSRNLAQYVDGMNKPTAGVRMYVPAHLGGVHKTLMQYGYKMKERYGSEFKRNIRFDDIEHSLCIDIKIPGSDSWMTVGYDRALADRRAWAKSVQDGSGDMLSSIPQLPACEDSTTQLPLQLQHLLHPSARQAQPHVSSPTTTPAAPAPSVNPYSVLRPSNLVVGQQYSSCGPPTSLAPMQTSDSSREEEAWGNKK